jgi:Uncharacterised nucleotidyltransferase
MPSTRAVPSRWQVSAGSRVRIGEQVLGWWRRRDIDRIDVVGWGEAQWTAARFAVQAHGIGPWLHRRLVAHAPTEPRVAAFLAYVAQCFALNRARYALWRTELERVLATADRARIPLVALKGAALMPTIWVEPEIRPTSDIDLLARPADRHALDAALADLGWTLHGEVPRHRAFYLTRLGLAPRSDIGEHPEQPLRLEIHEHARQTFLGLDHDATAALWQGATPVPVGATTMWMSSPSALFEHVLVHTAFDLARRMTRFVKLEDLRVLAARLSDDDWSRLVARAHASRLEPFVLAPLVMAGRYLGPIAPDAVIRELEAATPRALAAWLQRMPLSYFTVCGSHGGGLANAWSRVRWLPPGRAWMTGARRLLMPSRAERLDEFAAVGHATSLWAYYRAQLARWRG